MDFAKVLFEFYPAEILKSDLLTPQLSKNTDGVFQDAVAVLLSLVGYSVVVLGKKNRGKKQLEKIQLESGFEAGSADIVAFRENNKLLLIDCTTGAVDDPKIRKLQQTVNYLSSEDDRKNSKIMGLIFSSQNCKELRTHYHEDINIVDLSRLRILFALMLEGRIDEARTNLLIPY